MNLLRNIKLLSVGLVLVGSVVAQAPVQPQFSYAHKTEIAWNNNPGFKLDDCIERTAKVFKKHLNQSILFDPAFVRQADKVREHHLKSKHATEFVGKMYDIHTDDGVTIGATYFDRGSDTLMVIGAGFTNEREIMTPFVSMFADYDVVLFDFRGHGHNPVSIWDPSTWNFNFTKLTFGVDGNLVTLGVDEDKDVFAVVDGFKRLKAEINQGKTYRRVFGLGVCYGAFIMAKSLSLNPGLFDKLILDGCWLSLPLFIEKAKDDLRSLCVPQRGGWRNHWFFGRQVVKDAAEYITGNFLLPLNAISLLDYAPNIKDTELLFFFGKDDYMIRRHEFEQLWNAFNVENNVKKTVVITSNEHVLNHLKQKELYSMTSHLFFDLPQEQMLRCLTNKDELVNHYLAKMKALCDEQK